MGAQTKWTCDGCDAVALTDFGSKPDDWKQVRLSWEGLEGYPTCIRAGVRASDLCPNCASSLVEQMNPLRWTRTAPTPAAEGGE